MSAIRRLAKSINKRRIADALLSAADSTEATRLVNARSNTDAYFKFEWLQDASTPADVIALSFHPSQCTVGLPPMLRSNQAAHGLMERLVDTLLLMRDCRGMATTGSLLLNIGDQGAAPGLAFCENRPEFTLIPDPYYVNTTLNAELSAQFSPLWRPWRLRRRAVLWRGSTTGQAHTSDWRELDRVRLCRIAATRPERFDVGITGVLQLNEADTAAVKASGYLRPHIRMRRFHRYRYQLDIDGNTNSWGCFNKLLTGSTLLKVDSRLGYRQWYYDQMVAWTHYVPVKADLSDLLERVEWLINNDAEARRIGEAGRKLALSMPLEHETARTRAIVEKYLREH